MYTNFMNVLTFINLYFQTGEEDEWVNFFIYIKYTSHRMIILNLIFLWYMAKMM